MSEEDKMLERVGGIPIATLRSALADIDCPVKRVKITLSDGIKNLYLDLKDSGRVFLYDRNGSDRLWLSHEQPPLDFNEDYGCEWDFRITRYDRSAGAKLKIFCRVPDFAMHNLRVVMENGSSNNGKNE